MTDDARGWAAATRVERSSADRGPGEQDGAVVKPSDDPTAALLWAACRVEPDIAGCEQALAAGADLVVAADKAVAQRVSGLLWRSLEERVDPAAPWAGPLAADAARCRAQAQLLGPRVGERLLEPLRVAGLAPLVFKGMAIAARYPAPGLRAMDDIDLILPKAAHARAVQVLEQNGWVPVPRSGAHYDAVFTHQAIPGLPVELHGELTTRRRRVNRLTAAELWRRRRPATVAGVEVFGLPAELELVALAAHAAKPFHTFERLAWVVDLAVLVGAAHAAGSPPDWAEVRAIAERTRTRTAVAVALTQARRLGSDPPAALCRVDTGGPRRADLTALVRQDWPVLERTDHLRYRLALSLIDDPRLVARRLAVEVTSEGALRAPARLADLVRRASTAARAPAAGSGAHRTE